MYAQGIWLLPIRYLSKIYSYPETKKLSLLVNGGFFFFVMYLENSVSSGLNQKVLFPVYKRGCFLEETASFI